MQDWPGASPMTLDYRPGRFFVPNDAPVPSAEVAVSALQFWQWAIRGAPVVASSDEARSALRDLADWYTRLSEDDGYHKPPPRNGVDALTELEDGPQSERRRVLFTYWSVRVAEGLANVRRCKDSEADEQQLGAALAQLDLSLRTAFDLLI